MATKNDVFSYLNFAAQLAIDADQKYVVRKACVGAIGFRTDGTLVHACNGGDQLNVSPASHAEARLLRKIDKYAPVIYVARYRRDTGKLALARPCSTCLPRLKSMKIKVVYYSISDSEYGMIDIHRLIERDGIKFLSIGGEIGKRDGLKIRFL